MYSKDLLKKLYTTMQRIRLCEESLVDPILRGEVRCPVHLYSGEEAVATGVCAALTKKDYIFSTHRSHGHYLAKGGDLRKLIAEIYGKETGCSRGRGGSMHVVCPEVGMIGSAPIVAGTISLAVGAALSSSIRQDKKVTVSFFGDGATGEGVLFESLNFAALKKLPVIFACENNFYSTHLPVTEHRPDRKICDIAKPFGIKSFRVDGNDVLKSYNLSLQAVELCRKGEGPVFIEFLTFRLRGHVGPFDNINGNHTDIRPIAEIERWKKKDPIERLKNYLVRKKIYSSKDIKNIDLGIEKEIENAHKFAKNSRNPNMSEVMRYVFR
jgi:acetoin:2,6-dichlorophenolindophenol oxidoreductase subunit alpha